MGNLSVIGKVHIKDINALREWYAAGDFKKWHKVNWSPELAAYHHIKWEDTDQIAFYQMQDQIPGLSESLDRTGSWIRIIPTIHQIRCVLSQEKQHHPLFLQVRDFLLMI